MSGLSIFIENETDLGGGYLRVIRRAVREAADACAAAYVEACPAGAELGVTLVDDSRIAELNRVYRGIDAATDVLSFPIQTDLLPMNGGGICPETSSGILSGILSEISFGDIVISVDKARRQAAEYGHSLERELGFLAVHGALHLFGYDHERPEDEAAMLAKQREILENCGLGV